MGRKLGDFCILIHNCKKCGKPLEFTKRLFIQYSSKGFPEHHYECRYTPEVKEKMSKSNKKWCETHERYANSGSFKKGVSCPEERKEKIRKTINEYFRRRKEISVELLKPEITPEIKQVLLTEQEKLQIALKRLKENVDKKLNIKPKKTEKPKKEEDNSYASRISSLLEPKETKMNTWIFCIREGFKIKKCNHKITCKFYPC